jgi:hypothetical protein
MPAENPSRVRLHVNDPQAVVIDDERNIGRHDEARLSGPTHGASYPSLTHILIFDPVKLAA